MTMCHKMGAVELSLSRKREGAKSQKRERVLLERNSAEGNRNILFDFFFAVSHLRVFAIPFQFNVCLLSICLGREANDVEWCPCTYRPLSL
jgi:hypothetical protein